MICNWTDGLGNEHTTLLLAAFSLDGSLWAVTENPRTKLPVLLIVQETGSEDWLCVTAG